MADQISFLGYGIRNCEDAIRWACVLEATAPKAGNVHPGRSFANLNFADFVIAADITARELSQGEIRISQRMLATVQATRAATGTNVNLGIVLLLGPLIAADQSFPDRVKTAADWIRSIKNVIDAFDSRDGQNIYSAIAAAMAGGLGETESMDVRETHQSIDIRAAMELAQDRDRVALQYATNFSDLIHNVVPTLSDAIEQSGDVLRGIARAHVRLLSSTPDTLIARKCGMSVAQQVSARASAVDVANDASMRDFDETLRDADHKLNPGTTADLIAAGLFVLLRSLPMNDPAPIK